MTYTIYIVDYVRYTCVFNNYEINMLYIRNKLHMTFPTCQQYIDKYKYTYYIHCVYTFVYEIQILHSHYIYMKYTCYSLYTIYARYTWMCDV